MWWLSRFAITVHGLTRGVGDTIFLSSDGKPWFRLDEQRHDALLSHHAAAMSPVAVDHAARHFFRRLETREPAVHLARIASIDAAGCQILSHMLAPAARMDPTGNLANALSSIRRDEGRHIRIARRLALDLGVDAATLNEISSTVRHSFAKLLESRAAYFEALGIDSVAMIGSIERDR